jgi:OOP family OmpA-OmpF porin
MRKVLALFFLFCLLANTSFGQNAQKRAKAFGVSFFLNDYATPQRIRTTSLTTVFRDDKWAKFREMSPGIAVTYFTGLTTHIDFAGTLGASYVNYPTANKTFNTEGLLLEGDASANIKMFSEDYWVSPYLNVGLGVSKYRSYYGAFVPLGVGLKVNFFDEAHLFLNTQYRIPVTTETSNYHLMYSIGFAGVIGKK